MVCAFKRLLYKVAFQSSSVFSVYFDASELCNDLDFQFGQSAQGLTAIATRTFSIKVDNTVYDAKLEAECCSFSV